MADENTDNDFLSRGFEVLASGERVFFYLLTDDFPNETSWRLLDEDGVVVYQGGPYVNPASVLNGEWCLVDGCYTFEIYDAFGDGMSAPDNMGDYNITNSDGKIFARLTEADFGAVEVKEFCTPFVCALESEVTTVVESEFAAEDGQIIINASTNGLPPFEYSINGGIDFYDSPIFTGLSGNIYYVVVKDANGCEVEKEIILETCTLQFNTIATNTTLGLADGSILINTDGGIPPFIYSIDNGDTFQDSSLFENLDTGNYVILVQDSLGCIFLNETTINSMPVGLNDFDFENNIQILPNPTEGIFRIHITGVLDFDSREVEILNVLGQSLIHHRLQRNGEKLTGKISLVDYPPGIYFVRIRQLGTHLIRRVVKR